MLVRYLSRVSRCCCSGSVAAVVLLAPHLGLATNRVVCVDPGHPGAPGENTGGQNQFCKEWEINFWVGSELFSSWLYAAPDFRNSIMTKYSKDVPVSLAGRVQISETGNQGGPCDAFVSVHHQGSDVTPEFTETWFTTSDDQAGWKGLESQDLAASTADCILEEFTQAYSYDNRGAKNAGTAYHVLRWNDVAPTFIGEAAIISNNSHVATVLGTELCGGQFANAVAEEAEGYWCGLYNYYYTTAIGTAISATPGYGYVRLDWEDTDPSSSIDYDIYRGDSCRGPFQYRATVDGVNEQADYYYYDNSVAYAHEYHYYIHVSTGEVTQPVSATPWGVPQPSIPAVPTSVVGTGAPSGGGFGTVDLAWSASAGATEYLVYRSIVVPNWDCGVNVSAQGSTTGLSFQDANVPIQASVFYRVVASNATGISELSDEEEVIIDATGVADLATSPPLELDLRSLSWSRSEKAIFEMELPKEVSCTVEVFNVQGQKVATPWSGTKTVGSHRIVWTGKDLSGQNVGAGVYFARLATADGEQRTAKVVVVR